MQLGQVLTNAERAAGAGDHDCPDGGLLSVTQRGRELLAQRVVERVQHVGPVQGDRQHGLVASRFNLHGAS